MEAVPFLEKALTAWAKVRFAEPEVIEGKAGKKWPIQWRVTADNLAKDDYYVLSDVDAIPEETYVISSVLKMLGTAGREKMGMALIRPIFSEGGRVRVVRKGIVGKWPPVETVNYDEEHAEAVINAGYLVETWDDIHYRQLPSLIVN